MSGPYMTTRRPAGNATPRGSSSGRPTIGLLIVNTVRTWEIQQWRGVDDAARELDVNLICFPGKELRSALGFNAQANILYDLVHAERVDGIMLVASSFSNYVGHEELIEFCARYRSLPMVSIEDAIEGIPSVLLDNYHAMREVMIHLIEAHGCRRIAFITTEFQNRIGFKERFRAYKDTLSEAGIRFDPGLVSPPAIHEGPKGNADYDEWLQVDRAAEWDALVGTNDWVALEALDRLQSQGIRVPEDLAVVGFDDMAEDRAVTPPLTTEHPPFYEMGQKATEMLLALIQGKDVPEQVVVPSHLIVRQSCGCLDQTVAQAAIGPMEAGSKPLAADLSARRKQIVSAMAEAVGQSPRSTDSGWEERLFDSFLAEVKGGPPGGFLSTLDEALRRVTAAGGQALEWQGAVSVLRRQASPCLDGRMSRNAEDLLQQGRAMIGEISERAQVHLRLQAARQAEVLREIGANLITTFDVDGLMDILARELPRLDIPGCHLSLYEYPIPYQYPQPAPERSRLHLLFNNKGRVDLEPGGRPFRTYQLMPDGLWPGDRQVSFVIEPLQFRENQLGFVIFEARPSDGQVYDALREVISSPLQGARLVQQTNEARQKTEESNSFIESVIASMIDAVAVVDTQGKIIKVNEAFSNLFFRGVDAQGEKRILGRDIADFLPVEKILGERFSHQFRLHNAVSNIEIFDQRNEQGMVPLSLSAAPVYDSKSGITGIVIILRDISLQKDTEKSLKYIASHDALTELPNRILLSDRVSQSIARAGRYHTAMAILLLDLDHFKEVNDTMGHDAGDCLLKETASRLKSCLREYDTVARMGGDEFVLVITDIKDAKEVEVVGHRVLSGFEKPIVIDGRELHITTSIGISMYPNDGDTLEILLRNADIAMYSAKRLNGNTFCFFLPEMATVSEENASIKNSLIRAVERNQFVLHYQPLIETDTGRIIAAEALIRWMHPEQGLVMPLQFITAAETTGLILPIGEWVLRTACAQCRTWQREGHEGFPVSVNISARQLYDIHLTDKILAILHESGLPPECLILEITESSAMQNIENSIAVIEGLRRHGMRIFLDDFGSGYSSLNWLKMLPVQAIKIDRRFISNIVNDPFDAAIVRAIIAMAHSMKKAVIAEGVEDDEQLEFLKSITYSPDVGLKCDEVQGFLFSRPVAAEEFARLLDSQKK